MYNMATRTTTVTRVNGTSAAHTALSLQNRAVTHGVFTALLPEGGVAAEGLIEHPAVRGLSEEERRTVEMAAERMTQVISSSPNITVEKTVRELKDSRWAVNGDNLHDEFREVERRTFSDGVHWGRVIAFLAFSVSFAAYVSSRGIKGGVGSVFAWTNQTLNETLVDFLQREGWVSSVYVCVCVSKYCNKRVSVRR